VYAYRVKRVFVDDKDIQGKQGGNGYANFGINPTGVVVIVRPDGYVGTIVPFDNVKDVEGYFASFMGSYGAPMSKL
jgi:phenol 2-monooxygenase